MGGKYFNLIYRGSADGFEPSDFHKFCDNKGSTISVIKTTENEIFGGYTSLEWKSPEEQENSEDSNKEEDWKNDEEAFLFSVN